jgi:hypothetical protein
MANVLFGLLSVAFLVLLSSRVHFHFSFNLTISRCASRQNGRKVSGLSGRGPGSDSGRALPAIQDIGERARKAAEADLQSALVNLGMQHQQAVLLAGKAMQQGKDFDSRIRWAIRNAA